MLIGLLADIHGNLEALRAVLDDVHRSRPDILVCLGDFVGYGASPNECVLTLREELQIAVCGNHDLAALKKISSDDFNADAASAVQWTSEQLNQEVRGYLMELPSSTEGHGVLFAHASPRDPIFEYVVDPFVAAANFQECDFEVAVVGHTHVPAMFSLHKEELLAPHVLHGEVLSFAGRRALLNPGAVGQPRDRDPRASWGLLDVEKQRFWVRRVEYPISEAQSRISKAGLPRFVSQRLEHGM